MNNVFFQKLGLPKKIVSRNISGWHHNRWLGTWHCWHFETGGSNPGRGLPTWSPHVLSVLMWISSEFSSLHPRSKNMHVSLICDSKWQPVLGVSLLGSTPADHHGPEKEERGIDDGWDYISICEKKKLPSVQLSWSCKLAAASERGFYTKL